MNLYDCFMYFDEDLILDLRLNMLNKYVKKFIITESTYLHSGREKKLNFDPIKFSKFKDKIEYIIIDKPPDGIETINENDLLSMLNPIIKSNSPWKNDASNVVVNYFLERGQKNKAEEYIKLQKLD